MNLAELGRRFAEGATLADLARETGVSKSTVRVQLIRAGYGELLDERAGNRGGHRSYALTDVQMAEMYRDGATLEQVAKAAGCGRETAYEHLLRQGLEHLLRARQGRGMRSRRQPTGPLPPHEVIRLRRLVGLPDVLPHEVDATLRCAARVA